MDELVKHLASLGYDLPSPILDGNLHRFPYQGSKDAAWMIGWQNNKMKGTGVYIVCQFGNWRTRETHLYKPDGLSKAEESAISSLISAAKKKVNAEKRAKQEEAATRAAHYVSVSKTEGLPPYMQKKGFTKLYGCTVYGDNLQVPMRDVAGKIWGMQRILPDGSKLFMSGQRIQGCFHVIGELKESAILCEGFATGVSIHEATGETVVVAFSAGNLKAVVMEFLKHHEIHWKIAGDDDRFKERNAGRTAAEEAALVAQCSVVFPRFQSDEGEPTDFNDLHAREGLAQVKDQLRDEPMPEAGFLPLGYDDGAYFFYHIPSSDIVKTTGFSRPNLLEIAPLKFWTSRYTPPEGGKTDWTSACDDLIQTSRKVGQFDANRVRGTGVWLDAGRVVINSGKHLIVDRRRYNLHSLRSSFVYVKTKNQMGDFAEPLTVQECRPLIDLCHELRWENPNSSYLLPGWLAVARIAGALPIRPHIWITGASATGKSSIMERVVKPSLGFARNRVDVMGGTTEAGIRQSLKASSVPMLFDEFESNNEASRQRHEAIIELMRNSWSMSSGQIIKGSAGGMSQSFQVAFSALVASIGVTLITEADKSRFSVLDLKRHSDDPKQWKKIDSLMRQIDENFGERLFARMVNMVPIILRNYETMKDAIARVTRQRLGQQVGMLMAGYYALISDELITETVADGMVEDMDLVEQEGERVTDEQSCLDHLLTAHIRLDNDHGSWTKSIEEVIRDAHAGEIMALKKFGVIVQADAILISTDCWFLKRHYDKTRWIDWTKALRRLDGATAYKNSRFDKVTKATRIPVATLKLPIGND